MSTNDCRHVRREIDQSELGQRLSEGSESHINECASCAAFRIERNRLRELVGGLQPVTAPADFDMRLRARIARERDQRSTQASFFRVFMSTPAISVAAIIVMIVGGLVWMKQRAVQLPIPVAVNQPSQLLPATTATVDEKATDSAPKAVELASNPATDNSELASAPRRSASRPPSSANSVQSADFGVARAESYQLSPDRAGEVSLAAPTKPMVVTVYDEKGGSKKIQLPPISFGAQRLMEKGTPVSLNNTRDW